MNIIEMSNVTVKYNTHVAVERVNINIKEGELVCLVGENGSGKSTIIKTIVGLKIQDKGNVKVNIAPGQISYLEQFNMKDSTFPATAKEIIMTGMQTKKLKLFYNKSDYEALDEVCKIFSIKNILNKQIGELSGGQRQRVMLARAMINRPKVLILDEPCSGLDKKISGKLYETLINLNKDMGTTIVMAIHDIEELEKISKEKNIDIRVLQVAKEIKFDGKLKDWKGL